MGDEYEVESVTQARLKRLPRGKATWEFFVKWKGYDKLSDNTWEPTSSFDNGSEHILKKFWSRVDTGGRDIDDLKQFKVGEELFATGPPRGMKKKKSHPKPSTHEQPPPPPPSTSREREANESSRTSKKRRTSEGASEEPPLKRTRARRPTEKAVGGRQSLGGEKNVLDSARGKKRRRASSPGPSRSSPPLRQSSSLFGPDIGDVTDADADGDTDEVEDELMMTTPNNADNRSAQDMNIDTDQKPEFDDLVPFDETGVTIEVEQTATNDAPEEPGSPNPLFGSPSLLNGESSGRTPAKTALPSHRARAANPRVKLVDDPLVDQGMGNAILAKSRFLARNGQSSSTSQIEDGTGSTSQGLPSGLKLHRSAPSGKNKSSLLTVQNGELKSVKGQYHPVTDSAAKEIPLVPEGERDRGFTVTSWGDSDAADDIDLGHLPEMTPPPAPVPSGAELLEAAGLKEDAHTLPDFEDDTTAKGPDANTEVLKDTPSKSAEDEATEKRLALAKEQLFPSAQSSSSITNDAPTGNASTIFGALYVGISKPLVPTPDASGDSAAFNFMIDELTTIPVTFKDKHQVPGSKSMDAIVGETSTTRPGSFYGTQDALAIVSALRGGGSGARVVPDTDADDAQKGSFEVFLTRLESGQVYAATIAGELLVFYSSRNSAIGERLSAPEHLIGLSRSLLVSRAIVENNTAYANAVYRSATLAK
ncbi:hypothetical protein BV22DRAFT_1134159 [Leucogyrophana mollusca]|uniref:Uncharacterized protein n=1 Tax=Leucogyrophana mollusca TaxID=85980 RepID=A0ACB8B021_9AGAM|nr:hypothetical protein BV22DRAFT_1134159 [Leucogyrophana mollusca]